MDIPSPPKKNFLREVFSEDGEGSASRTMMGFHALVGSGCLLYATIHNHLIPDPMTVTGITGFVTAPYALNALHKAVGIIADSKSGS